MTPTPVSTPRRNPWPIAIVIYFIFFGGFVVAFAVFALHQKVDLVSRDYYDDELQFQKQIDRVSRTQSIKDQVAIGYDAQRSQITITLPVSHREASGTVRLYRPSDEAADLKLNLSINARGVQAVDASKLRAGLWKVRVQWRLNGEEYFFDQSVVIDSHSRT